MHAVLPVLNAFIEDTCVIMVIAYLLARGRMLALLVNSQRNVRQTSAVGVTFGLVALTEAIFPGLREPYVLHTLIITFAILVCGSRVGLVAVGTVVLGVTFLQPPLGVLETTLTLFASALAATILQRLSHARFQLVHGFLAGICSQGVVVLLHQLPLPGFRVSANASTPAHATIAILANGFGVMLLQLLLNDARMRADSESNRLEAERAHALVTESQLVALRARVHPHFLFNALTSIAALCNLAPPKAEMAVLRLSQLMRRALVLDISTPVPFSEEIDYVRGYLEIESARFGSRLQILWEIDPALYTVRVPAFALQTLVENSVGHGITPRPGPGKIRIIARQSLNRVLIAVQDDGVGMQRREQGIEKKGRGKREQRIGKREQGTGNREQGRERMHGLQIVSDQLMLLYGRRGRLRIFSREGVGTLVAFGIPDRSYQSDAHSNVSKIAEERR